MKKVVLTVFIFLVLLAGTTIPGQAQDKPNILVIWGDDIGYWNISAYNQGMMGYETPNIDRIANEGALFTDWYAQQSCTAGRAAFILGYGYSTGNILLDPSLPIEDSRAKLHSISLGYAQVFSLFGQMATFNVVVPMAIGTWRGLVEEEPTSVSRNGFGDPILNLSVNFFGAPALSGQRFLAHREKFILGGSLRVRVPLGQYDETKLINLGTNRWMFRPSLGGSVKLKKWILEANVSSWFFTRNPNFYGGNDLIQKPLYALQLHAIYQFRPGLWIAVSAGRSNGGDLVVNDINLENTQKNSRFGATLAMPLGGSHGLSLVFTTGISTRFGADFDIFGIVYKYRWTSGKSQP